MGRRRGIRRKRENSRDRKKNKFTRGKKNNCFIIYLLSVRMLYLAKYYPYLVVFYSQTNIYILRMAKIGQLLMIHETLIIQS